MSKENSYKMIVRNEKYYDLPVNSNDKEMQSGFHSNISTTRINLMEPISQLGALSRQNSDIEVPITPHTPQIIDSFQNYHNIDKPIEVNKQEKQVQYNPNISLSQQNPVGNNSFTVQRDSLLQIQNMKQNNNIEMSLSNLDISQLQNIQFIDERQNKNYIAKAKPDSDTNSSQYDNYIKIKTQKEGSSSEERSNEFNSTKKGLENRIYKKSIRKAHFKIQDLEKGDQKIFNTKSLNGVSINIYKKNDKVGAAGVGNRVLQLIIIRNKYVQNILQLSEKYRLKNLSKNQFQFFNDKSMIPHSQWGYFKNITPLESDELNGNKLQIFDKIMQKIYNYLNGESRCKLISSVSVFYPSNPFKFVLDCLSVLGILYAFFLIPIFFVFETYPPIGNYILMFIIILDAFVTLNTSYYERARLITSRGEIFISYIKNRLLIDVLAFTSLLVVEFRIRGSGFGDIVPQTDIELVLCIFTTYIACSMFAFAINKIGLVLQQIESESNKKNQFLQSINNYMKKKKISQTLQYTIREYIEYYFQESIEEDHNIEQQIFEILSENLKKQLLLESNKILKESPIFCRNFSSSLLEKTIELIEEVKFVPEQYIYLSGERSSDIFFVNSGEVEVVFGEIEEKKIKHVQVIKTLKRGAVFGELEFFSGFDRQYSIRSKYFSTVLRINQKDFSSLLKEYPEDYEIFCQIKDQIRILKNQRSIGSYCYSCNNIHHLFVNCPYTAYIPNRTKLFKELNRQIDQERFNINDCLGTNDTKKIEIVQKQMSANKRHRGEVKILFQCQEKFLEENISFIEKSSWYQQSSDEQLQNYYDSQKDDDIIEMMTSDSSSQEDEEEEQSITDNFIRSYESLKCISKQDSLSPTKLRHYSLFVPGNSQPLQNNYSKFKNQGNSHILLTESSTRGSLGQNQLQNNVNSNVTYASYPKNKHSKTGLAKVEEEQSCMISQFNDIAGQSILTASNNSQDINTIDKEKVATSIVCIGNQQSQQGNDNMKREIIQLSVSNIDMNASNKPSPTPKKQQINNSQFSKKMLEFNRTHIKDAPDKFTFPSSQLLKKTHNKDNNIYNQGASTNKNRKSIIKQTNSPQMKRRGRQYSQGKKVSNGMTPKNRQVHSPSKKESSLFYKYDSRRHIYTIPPNSPSQFANCQALNINSHFPDELLEQKLFNLDQEWSMDKFDIMKEYSHYFKKNNVSQVLLEYSIFWKKRMQQYTYWQLSNKRKKSSITYNNISSLPSKYSSSKGSILFNTQHKKSMLNVEKSSLDQIKNF